MLHSVDFDSLVKVAVFGDDSSMLGASGSMATYCEHDGAACHFAYVCGLGINSDCSFDFEQLTLKVSLIFQLEFQTS